MNKLDRHLQTKHPLHRDKSKDFFICKEESFKKQCFDGGKAFKGNGGALRASYQVSLHIAKAKKPHSIGEQLIKPCLKDVCLSVLESSARKWGQSMSTYSSTVRYGGSPREKFYRECGSMREQLMAYLKNEDANLVKHFEDKRWLARFAYLVDIFNKLNMLNTSLQGKENSILDLEDGIQGFE
ncbi:hypothetical protein JOQ06_018224 [Pogonophryne albipinna]|uniref:Uncharacterized protein n=1 Tax=Pogonophryne albipinna TaxID=1090488 RepID=A0AAD6AIN8_9TELE|nr:hypothetical protein JOQ06_018224 [Pogonophryne albipinna]